MAKNVFCVSVRESLVDQKKEVCKSIPFSEFVARCIYLYKFNDFKNMVSGVVLKK
ncbi:hypothetical protein [Polynucleobacter sp.]|uniref:hypothetical protein n=1 Tax=Polynucleobacter sp. TaxID=2029855 RepID=UPI003F698E4C